MSKIANLISHGLPEFATQALHDRGITELEPLQKKAVEAGLFKGRNILAMAPTSSGKTLIGELAALQHIVSKKGAVILTSHKALAYEKYLTLRECYSKYENFFCHTTIATGDEVTPESKANEVSFTVATYEKWYHLLLDRPESIYKKSLVIVDELQMMGDKIRGSIVEALITWLRLKAPDTQIIGLSATIPNAEELSNWLGAELVSVTQRPIPLVEQIWSKDGIHQINRDVSTEIEHSESTRQPVQTIEAIKILEVKGYLPGIVFCIKKQDAEDLARTCGEMRERRPECEELINELDENVETDPTTRKLRSLLPKGMAFHNANLSLDERRLIEASFRTGKLDILFATTTLSAGVNLPAQTVLFDSCLRDWLLEYITSTEYMNMAGRAGRKGLAERGTSILLARNGAELARFIGYLEGQPEEVDSRLTGQHLDRIILQSVVAGIAESRQELLDFFNASFCGWLSQDAPLFAGGELEKALTDLEDYGMVQKSSDDFLAATHLGRATAASGLLPESGYQIYESLTNLSAIFDFSQRSTYERRILFLSSSCRDISPSVDSSVLLWVHQRDYSLSNIVQSDYYGLVNSGNIESPDRSLFSSACAYEYMNGASFRDIQKLGRYASKGNMQQLATRLAWVLQAAAIVEGSRGAAANRELQRWLRLIAKRLEYGVTEEATQILAIARLGDVRGFGRARAQLLADKGLHDLTKLLELDINELAALLKSEQRASALRKAAIAYLEQPSLHFREDHIGRAISLGRNHHLIKEFYDKLGNNFNIATLRLLQTIYSNTREQDVGGESEPDLAIPLKEGLLVIECKTKTSESGTIGLHESFEVESKSAHINPVGMVTLGKPAFDSVPIDRAANMNTCLISHTTMCEAIVAIWEGKLNPDDLIKILRMPGYISINYLYDYMKYGTSQI